MGFAYGTCAEVRVNVWVVDVYEKEHIALSEGIFKHAHTFMLT